MYQHNFAFVYEGWIPIPAIWNQLQTICLSTLYHFQKKFHRHYMNFRSENFSYVSYRFRVNQSSLKYLNLFQEKDFSYVNHRFLCKSVLSKILKSVQREFIPRKFPSQTFKYLITSIHWSHVSINRMPTLNIRLFINSWHLQSYGNIFLLIDYQTQYKHLL